MVVDPQTLETQGQETERTIVKWNFREENQKKNELSLVPFRIMHIFAPLFLGTKIRRL
jgi:hypothetical protein